LDKDLIQSSIIEKQLSIAAGQNQFNWKVFKETDKNSLNHDTEPNDVRSEFKIGNYSWIIILNTLPSGLVDSLFKSGRGIYFFIFIFIALLLLFGLIFTLKAVNSEVHLAKMKSGFISTVSHEFKSPLTSIRHIAEMLTEGKVKTEQRKLQYYNVVLDQTERLSHLIENLLDFSKIEAGKKVFFFEETDFRDFLEQHVEIFKRRTAHDSLEITSDIQQDLPKIKLDKNSISQVINNLLDNAYKYSGETKQIKVKSFSNNGTITLNVQDFGLGIAKTEQEKIFERFYRVGDDLTRKIKGSGIGLTLVKQIVDAHEGSIDVNSSPGHGSTFSIQLPIKK
jgi:signal transduction histidine kinase